MSDRPLRRARLLPDEVAAGLRASAADDVVTIVQAFRADGILIGEDDAYEAWRRLSDTHAAAWLILYDEDADIRSRLLPFLEVD